MGQGDSTALPAGSKRQVTESELEEPPAKAVKTGIYKKPYIYNREQSGSVLECLTRD